MTRIFTRTSAIVAVICTIAAGALFTVSSANGQGPESRYRTATAEYRTISETREEVGTINPVTNAEVAFPAAGTVSTVLVKEGETVKSGQVLATLDRASLEVAIRQAQSVLDQAELDLEQALNGEAVGTGRASSTSANRTTGISAATSAATSNATTVFTTAAAPAATTTVQQASPTSQSGDSEFRAAQQAVLDAQARVSADLVAAQKALETVSQGCGALEESTGEDELSVTTTTTTTTTTDSSSNDLGLCYQLLTTALEAQNTLQASQEVLANAVSAYSALITERSANQQGEAAPNTNNPDGSEPSSNTDTNSSGAPSESGTRTGSGTAGATSQDTVPSAQRLIAYQSKIDAAAADLLVAQAALRQATIVSPIDGTVSSVGLAAGDEVSAASDTATISINGESGFEVTAIVGVDDLPDLEVGQVATVTPDGSERSFDGEVVAIGLTSTSEGSSTYPVTVSINGDGDGLRQGSVASISIVVASGKDVLAIPTSAVQPNGALHSVTVLANSKTRAVEVEVGAVGSAWTEITSGIEKGDVVVLADLEVPLPGSATDVESNAESVDGGTRNSAG
ncbi:MAG: biotin/lipoyl-binding protein, partial [Acidimicrobiales bacterium]|nr:biotin/lipoyl-binding protein [Acidimicrobiales bacterium]